MPRPLKISRRGALKTLFCASAALALNLRPQKLNAASFAEDDAHLLVIGDFGSGGNAQAAVARAMQKYVADHQVETQGMLLLGDNFYGKVAGGVKSTRWDSGFESMYPATAFPGPCWAVLGNHDYHDTTDGEKNQLEYARRPEGTRWTMPSKWYRLEFPKDNPTVTFLSLDSNLPSVSGGIVAGKKTRSSLTTEEEAEQLAFLKAELAKPRSAFTVVLAHHPIYSNGAHGDTRSLVKSWDGILEEHGVHVYMCGHDHDLQHLELEGRRTSFVVSGGGGARIRPLKSDRKVPYGKDVYGFSHLQVSRQRLIVRHIDANGTQVHAFTKLVDGTVKLEA
ncbi:MAG TPA: metallophosphoesterase [Pirellulaceae bacterium]|nr:metallophosphoesterase [Pirellulaceae bacterium]